MQYRSRQDLYHIFIQYIRTEAQRERHIANRRMFSVFLWCFLLPVVVSFTLVLLIKFHALPRSAKGYLDWLVLIFPLAYSLYFLGSEVIAEIPGAFRQGGMAITLGQPIKESEWREKVCEGFKKAVEATPAQWKWVISSFRIDLGAMQYRNRYLTALSGVVFFLIMQGIDWVTGEEMKVTWFKDSTRGWVEAAPDYSQFIGLGIFLVLLYLSGSQTHHTLQRYLNCAELIVKEQEEG